MVLGSLYLLVNFVFHCTWVTSEAYSSPSIVLAARQSNGDRVIFDDFREAYFWLRHNTPPDAKVMSWWDYGYQITAMANRTVIVDNNTWNNTHIATVGRAMSSYEDEAYEIMKELDVDYVLVVFGGVTGYSSDDINKSVIEKPKSILFELLPVCWWTVSSAKCYNLQLQLSLFFEYGFWWLTLQVSLDGSNRRGCVSYYQGTRLPQ